MISHLRHSTFLVDIWGENAVAEGRAKAKLTRGPVAGEGVSDGQNGKNGKNEVREKVRR